MTQEKRSEILEIAKLYYQDYEYRHKTFWEIVFKSIFAIIGLIGLPFFLAKEQFLTQILYFFPIISFVLCIFSILLLKSEAIRMQAIRERYKTLIKMLSTEYAEVPIKDLSKFSPLKIRITNQILFLYFSLLAISIFQLVLMLTGRFI